MRYISNDFYCPLCGEKNISLPRNKGKMRGKEHRKVMYCYRCKKVSNNIEVRNEQEAQKFKENWAAGVYAEEAAQSAAFCEENRSLGGLL